MQVFVDVTPEVDQRIAAGAKGGTFHGHLWDNAGGLMADSVHRPQDLRASGSTAPITASGGGLLKGIGKDIRMLQVQGISELQCSYLGMHEGLHALADIAAS